MPSTVKIHTESETVAVADLSRAVNIRLAELGIKRYELAERCGWRPSRLSDLFRQREIKQKTWERLCAGLLVDPGAFVLAVKHGQ